MSPSGGLTARQKSKTCGVYTERSPEGFTEPAVAGVAKGERDIRTAHACGQQTGRDAGPQLAVIAVERNTLRCGEQLCEVHG